MRMSVSPANLERDDVGLNHVHADILRHPVQR
jgi:hypothetical protein